MKEMEKCGIESLRGSEVGPVLRSTIQLDLTKSRGEFYSNFKLKLPLNRDFNASYPEMFKFPADFSVNDVPDIR